MKLNRLSHFDVYVLIILSSFIKLTHGSCQPYVVHLNPMN